MKLHSYLIMPYAPLWSSACHTDRQSNATVENFFRSAKKDLKAGVRLSFAEFAGERYKALQNNILH